MSAPTFAPLAAPPVGPGSLAPTGDAQRDPRPWNDARTVNGIRAADLDQGDLIVDDNGLIYGVVTVRTIGDDVALVLAYDETSRWILPLAHYSLSAHTLPRNRVVELFGYASS